MKARKMNWIPVILTLACLFSLNVVMAQTKGTSISTSGGEQDAAIKVTKTFEFDAGGIEISAVNGAADYIVYERSARSDSWTKSNTGKIDATTRRQVEICKTEAEAVKVEVKAKCDDCVTVRQVSCRERG